MNYRKIFTELTGMTPVKLPSARLSSYRGGGEFYNAFYPVHAADWHAVGRAQRAKLPLLNAGGCTNLLVRDKGYHGISVHTDCQTGIWQTGENLYVGAGERLPRLAVKAKDAGLSGLECLSGIPGTVGGACAMNAGAFGQEIADLLTAVHVYDWNADRFLRVVRAEIPFAYRTDGGFFREKTVIAAEFRLTFSLPSEVGKRMTEIAKKRADTQPHSPSLGSVFKQKDGMGIGYYLDKAGMKGKRIGGAEVSTKHAGFIVNVGNGTAHDYLQLADLCAETIHKLYGFTPEREFRTTPEL